MGQRKPGLWLRCVSIEVQDVTNRMDRVCDKCGVKPRDRRALVTLGSGRRASVICLCVQDATQYFDKLSLEASRARDYLSNKVTHIRVEVGFTLPEPLAKIRNRERKLAEKAGITLTDTRTGQNVKLPRLAHRRVNHA